VVRLLLGGIPWITLLGPDIPIGCAPLTPSKNCLALTLYNTSLGASCRLVTLPSGCLTTLLLTGTYSISCSSLSTALCYILTY
jgi:hypothetical protein